MHWSPILIADPKFVIPVFVISVLILHFFLIHVFKLNKVQWKYADYVWIFFTAIGLIAITAQVRASMTAQVIPRYTPWLISEFKILKLTIADQDYICEPRVRDNFSPPNFDAIEAERKFVCEWVKGLALELPDQVPVRVPDKEEPSFPRLAIISPPNIQDEALQGAVLRVRSVFDSYNSVRDEREALVTETKRNALEEISYAFGPLLTCLGLAIRITKVTGEIIIEKESKKSTDEDKPMTRVEGTPTEEIAAGGISDDEQSKNAG